MRGTTSALLFVASVLVVTGSAPATATPPPSASAAKPTPPRTTVSGPTAGRPGSVVPVVVTLWGQPARGTSPSFTARVGSGPTDCSGLIWRHGNAWSQRCFVELPRSSGGQTITARVSLARTGAPAAMAQSSQLQVAAAGATSDRIPIATRRRIERCWNTTSRIQLTFDDGYVTRQRLTQTLTILKRRKVKATFFFVGSWSRVNPWAVALVRKDGHRLGNHTNTHPSLTSLSDSAARREIRLGVRGTGSPRLMRPPYGAGAFSARTNRIIESEGQRACYWTTDTRDWAGVSATTIVRKVLVGDSETPPARAGGVVLMHTTAKSRSNQALDPMITGLRRKGLTLEPLP